MSLRARERRRLSRIQGALDRSDPQLVSLFVTFSRLTREEEMPYVERLRVRVDRLTAQGKRMRLVTFSRMRMIVITPVALVAAAAALLIGGLTSNAGTCKATLAATHSADRRVPVRARVAICPPVPIPWHPAMAGR